MKKLMAMALVLVLALGCFALTACGGGDGGNGKTTPTQKPASGGFALNSIPAYPGASDAEEFSMSIPGADTGEYERIEWRYYTTNDSVDDVISFYADRMPDYGWIEMATMDMGDMSWSYWSKNNEETGGFVGAVHEDDQTILWMWRGEGLASEDGDTPTETPTPKPTQAPTSVAGDFDWDDIPVYPGASDAEEFSMSIPGADTGEYERIEWRYHTTNDSATDVTSFYADRMPDNGWDETATMSIGDVSWSYWSKDNGDTGAFIAVVNEDGETNIMMWKGMGIE
jgi:ssRNA-specific RNase YbeY (16S rRNA maturation enzyme)